MSDTPTDDPIERARATGCVPTSTAGSTSSKNVPRGTSALEYCRLLAERPRRPKPADADLVLVPRHILRQVVKLADQHKPDKHPR